MADSTLVPRIPGDETTTQNTWILGPTPQLVDVHGPLRGLTYRLSSQLSDEDVPLLMRFMHKPLRAQQELKRASDPTRRNLILNANLRALADEPMAALRLLDDEGSPHDVAEPPYRLVRKKSGEIVKPLLKEAVAAINRSRSLPLTPTYKQVHFGGDTDVRYFKQKDRPAAILAQNSPTLEGQDDDGFFAGFGSSEDDSDYGTDSDAPYLGLLVRSLAPLYADYYDDELNSLADGQDDHTRTRSKYKSHLDKTHYPKIEWQLELLEFPKVLYQEKIMLRHQPVFLEQTFLSIDKKYLLGQIAVRNLLYEKNVTVRYTLDHWATIVEIPTIYVPDPPPVLRMNNYDRFVFKILLDLLFTGFAIDDDDKSGVLERVYELCVRFGTGEAEYWDNNDHKNYLIKVRRIEHLPEPATLTPQQEMPSTARSKQQAHIKKPKYSSSYLKRIVSEPSLSKSGESPTKSASPVKEYNDFEQNNYYLSSPLLLSLKNRETDDHPFSHKPRLVHGIDEKRTPSPASSLSQSMISIDSNSPTDDVSPDEDISPNEDVSPSDHVPIVPVSPKATKHKRIDSMTYKELLESYCFFSTPAGENNSTTTLVMSDEPNIRYDQNASSDSHPDRSIDPDSAFTVSSFLRN